MMTLLLWSGRLRAEITFLRLKRVIVRCGCGGCGRFSQRAAHGSGLLEGLQVKGDFANFVVSKQLVEFTDTTAIGFPHEVTRFDGVGLFDPLIEIRVLLFDVHRAVFGTMVEPTCCDGQARGNLSQVWSCDAYSTWIAVHLRGKLRTYRET